MTKRTTFILAGVIGLALAACGGGGSGGLVAPIVIHNGTLIDGTGAEPIPDAVVIVDQGVIIAAGPAAEIEIPGDATMVDAQGGTILPGLVDTHVHHLENLQMQDGRIGTVGRTLALTRPLYAGITTYRDLGSAFGDTESVADLRAALEAEGNLAPTIVVAGPLLAAQGAYALDAFAGQALGVEEGTAAADTVIRMIDNGVDQVKLFVEMQDFLLGDETPSLSAEQVQAMTEAAHERGIWATAHVSDIAEAELAVHNGIDELAHWPGSEPLPDDLIAAIAENGIPVVSTFALIGPDGDSVRALIEAGGTVVMGTDSPGVIPPDNVAQELGTMALAGMTPLEVISAATRDAAEVVGLGDVVGTIEDGKRADIIVVGGDPLDNLAVMRDIRVVMKGGALIELPE